MGVAFTMRTRQEIEKDLASAKSAYDAMANIKVGEGCSGQSKGMFLDNCVRRIEELEKELKSLPT